MSAPALRNEHDEIVAAWLVRRAQVHRQLARAFGREGRRSAYQRHVGIAGVLERDAAALRSGAFDPTRVAP